MRIIFATFFVLCFAVLPAQKMIWSSCAVNTDIEYTMYAMNTAVQEVCVGGPSGELSYRSEPAGLYNGTGAAQRSEYDVSRGGSYLFVYSFTGTLKWSYFGDQEEERLDGVCYDYRNRLTALLLLPKEDERQRNDYYDYSEEEEEEDSEEEEDEEPVSCYTLCRFDQDGDIIHRQCIPDLLDVDVTDFKSHPDGGFLVAGHASGKNFMRNPSLDAGPGGSDFLLYIDSTGKIVWGDALAYRKETCCSYGSEPEVAVDSKGNVIIAGAYMGGASFGGGAQVRMAPVPYDPPRYYHAMETYVASYSSKGKFQWVQTAGVQSTFSGLAAGNGNIYVGVMMQPRAGELFGVNVDTAEHQSVFVMILGENGKVKSGISTGSLSRVTLGIDEKENLVITGVIGIRTGYLKHPEPKEGKKRLEDVYVAFYSASGKYITHHEYNLLKISSDGGPFCMAVNTTQYFIGGQLWGVLPISLRLLNEGFPDVKIYGGGTFLARCGPK